MPTPTSWTTEGAAILRREQKMSSKTSGEGRAPATAALCPACGESLVLHECAGLLAIEAEATARPDGALRALDEFERRYDADMRKGHGMPGETRVRRIIAEVAAEYARLPAARPDAAALAEAFDWVRKELRRATFPDPVKVLGGEPLVLIQAVEDVLDRALARLPAAPAEYCTACRAYHVDPCVLAAAEGDDHD